VSPEIVLSPGRYGEDAGHHLGDFGPCCTNVASTLIGDMAELSVENLETALRRHASGSGEVYPSALRLIDAEEHWAGRLWDVAQLVLADQELMRYVVGGNRPEVVADCIGRWSESDLDLDEIQMILAGGGYDPDPFVPLSRAGLLDSALHLGDGRPRLIHGERAGAWISDTFALSAPQDVVLNVQRAIGGDPT
jgi:hypothetical protein